METSIERIIRKKLSAALDEEKKRLAAKLFTEVALQAGANDAAKKQKKSTQIAAMKVKISALSSKAATAKDPVAFRANLQAKKDKLDAATKELQAMK